VGGSGSVQLDPASSCADAIAMAFHFVLSAGPAFAVVDFTLLAFVVFGCAGETPSRWAIACAVQPLPSSFSTTSSRPVGSTGPCHCRVCLTRPASVLSAGSGPDRSPQPIHRHHVQPFFVGVGAGAGAERDPGDEPAAKSLPQLAQPLEVTAGDALVRLYLECDHPAVVELDHEVDLVLVVGAPVADGDCLLEPGDLFAQFPDDEGLQQVPELCQRGGVQGGQLWPG